MVNNSGPARAVYSIAVAAELAGVAEQSLRLYEQKGLITPHRTPGGTRRYSDDDVSRLRRVIELLGEGLNLVGARRILELEAVNAGLRSRVRHLEKRGQSREQQ